ncbi:response regulator transcription factor [Geodermatophilus sp. SYSU D00525]
MSLTGRDLELLHHLASGRSTATIAAAMSISTNTVRTRIHRLQNMLGAPARADVVPRARSLGLLHGREDPAGCGGAIPRQRGGEHAS